MNEIGVYPKPIQQYGALCFRNTPKGPQVLLITTRETRRWMIPTGWAISVLKPRKVAEREAWENVGVSGRAKKSPGEFLYDKVMQDGSGARPVVAVFLLEVRRCRKRFPEMAERDSVWPTPVEAARRVEGAGPGVPAAEEFRRMVERGERPP
ncbi:NUDIX hydrolase [Rhizobium leguminosarum]|uniref:NUDIX hydrolase n=1 Tax=Rhizobium leguminosarum TaxID=384 RepID=UPI0036D99CB6